MPARGARLTAAELAQEASLLMPAGPYGPAFLTTKNYFALKDYNYSDLYVLFVGHLADRIAGGRRFEQPWGKVAQLQTAALERMQRELTRRGFYADKIDGKAGMLTRAALGAYQKANGAAARLLADRKPCSTTCRRSENKNPAARAGFSLSREYASRDYGQKKRGLPR